MSISNHKIEDRILLRKACNDGCQASLAEIHNKHRASILAYLRKKLPNHNITEDVCQSIFMQIHEGKCKYDGSSEVKSYLFGVASNLCKQELKKENPKIFNQDQIQVDGDFLVEESVQDNPYEILENEESLQSLRAAIAQLPSKSRQIIELVYLKGKTRQQAANHLGDDYFAVCHSIRYGLKKLKEKISKATKLLF